MVKANFTLEQLRAAPHLSYSALNSYLNICQLQYYYRYIERLESECTPVALPFGSAFHAALSEQAQAAKQGEKLTVAQLTDAFATYFTASCNGSDNVVFKREESKDDMILLAAKMLDAALSDWRDYWNVDAVALPFQIEMPGIDIPLIGEMDMVVSESNPLDNDPETPCIVDFKTAACGLMTRLARISGNGLQLRVREDLPQEANVPIRRHNQDQESSSQALLYRAAAERLQPA